MSVYNIYFSPTGGTEKVAGIIAGRLDRKYIPADMIKNPHIFETLKLQENDICVISVPSFGGRVPDAAVKVLKKLSGNGSKAVLTAVYGNRHIDDTLIELYDILNERGFSCVAAIEAVAQHSLMPQYAAGRPDNHDRAELTDFAEKIISFLESPSGHKLDVPGNRPYKEYNGVPVKPITGSKCRGCGLCASECPAKAIPEDSPKDTDKELCISCMHCVSVCPHKARRKGRLITFVASRQLKKVCSGHKKNKLYLP